MNPSETGSLDDDKEAPLLNVSNSIKGFQWLVRPFNSRSTLALSQKHDIPDILARILSTRGIGIESIEDFLSPKIRNQMPNPSVLLDMDIATERIISAVTNKESIAIFGDYDVDGATSSALLMRFFRSIGILPEIYIPDRIKEGYGPNTPAIHSLAKKGVKVIITVDCGISSFEPIGEAKKAGVDVIVIDHHASGPDLPDALAIVNPNRIDEVSDLKTLAAVGVTYLFVVAISRGLRKLNWFNEKYPEPNILQWLDLVALGTICDVVSLTGFNRTMVTQGLKIMAMRRNQGIAAISDVAGITGPPSAYHAGFLIGPRVNAGGRVGRSNLSAKILSTSDTSEAKILADELEIYNSQRREIESNVLLEATDILSHLDNQQFKLAFVAKEGWHPGVIGIVASRLASAKSVPCIVISIDGNIAKGSGRSIRGIDLGSMIIAAKQSGIIENGGGHPMAAGFTVKSSKIDELSSFLSEKINASLISSDINLKKLMIDGVVTIEGANIELIRQIQRAGPFGSGNPEPRLAIPSATIVKADIVGNGHVRAFLRGGDIGGSLQAISFGTADHPLGQAILSGKHKQFHFVGYLRENIWQGRISPQLFIDDLCKDDKYYS